jgi:hypothetical protein
VTLQFTFTAARVQEVARQGNTLIVGVACNKACNVSVGGRLSRRFHHRVVRLAKATVTLRAHTGAELRIGLSRRALAVIHSSLRHHRRVFARLVGRAQAGAEVQVRHRRVRLLRGRTHHRR